MKRLFLGLVLIIAACTSPEARLEERLAIFKTKCEAFSTPPGIEMSRCIRDFELAFEADQQAQMRAAVAAGNAIARDDIARRREIESRVTIY